ncbi:PKD domain-containing protein [Agromyces seonyuensis]|uniref:PKD domain-containing protein n=1 Tax=Agromyces seonyuensis TaxID=2662446 RepID=A0A6I4NT79_9MICO|nr:PKD domain-containing protein [Agromyces seonyuensis]
MCAGSGVPGDPEPLLTLADLAAFKPVTPVADSLPHGGGLEHRPIAFTAVGTEQHVVAGTLLDRPADVRFTPALARWDFGDGASDSLDGPAAEHAYDERGTYTVQLAVDFTAEYSFNGSNWIPVAGTVVATAAPYEIRVFEVSTRLVRGTCDEYPSDPGC